MFPAFQLRSPLLLILAVEGLDEGMLCLVYFYMTQL